MVVNPEQIIVGAGTEYLYGLLIQLLGDDKIYGIENPGYPKIAKIYDSMHVSYSAIDLDKHGVCIDSLENHQIDIMHLSPSHHFPTGIITPISVVMNCLVGLLRMRIVISLKMIMTVNYALAENRSLHCKVLISLIKSFI